MSGVALDTPERQVLLGTALAGYGVLNRNGELSVRFAEKDFCSAMHNLIQAILAVYGLAYLSAAP